MTQQELAKKLRVTDRAVSRWERAIGAPDISLLEDLSTILNVSILEILHGEENLENTDQSVLNILKYEERQIRIWRKIGKFSLGIIELILFFIFLCFIIFPKYIEVNPNLEMHSVISPSMEPTYKICDAVVTKRVDIEVIKVGDVITYQMDGYTIMHRVIEKNVDDSGQVLLKTKGDRNINSDEKYVTVDNFIGIVDYHIPFLGRFLPINNSKLLFTFFLIIGFIGVIILHIILKK